MFEIRVEPDHKVLGLWKEAFEWMRKAYRCPVCSAKLEEVLWKWQNEDAPTS